MVRITNAEAEFVWLISSGWSPVGACLQVFKGEIKADEVLESLIQKLQQIKGGDDEPDHTVLRSSSGGVVHWYPGDPDDK